MKARVLATDETIDVEKRIDRVGRIEYVYYYAQSGESFQDYELEFLPDTPESVTIEGWVARDQKRNNNLNLHYEKPFRDYHDANDYPQGFWDNKREFYYPLPNNSFPEITWESEPLKVKITITPIEE